MSKKKPPVADAELAVLEFLWEVGPSTKREISAALYPAASASGAATVQKLLQRLEEKGYVLRDRSEFTHRIEAACTRSEFVGRQLECVADRLAGGSLASLFCQLVESRRLSARDRKRLKKLLDELES